MTKKKVIKKEVSKKVVPPKAGKSPRKVDKDLCIDQFKKGTDLFVEMSSRLPAVDLGYQTEPALQTTPYGDYSWRITSKEDASTTNFVIGLVGGTMLGTLAALSAAILFRLFF